MVWKHIRGALLALALSLSSVVSASAATELFATNFNPTVTLGAPSGFSGCPSTNGWQYFAGTDNSTGFAWPTSNQLFGGSIDIQVLVGAGTCPSAVPSNILNQIQSVIGPDGVSQVNALYQDVQVWKGGVTQDPFMAHPASDPGDVYVSEWIKFQPDLATRLGANGWRAFFEYKTSGDFRTAAYVYTDGSGNPYWHIQADNNANGGLSYQLFWSHYTPVSTTVPVGQWFHLEIFWHRTGNYNTNGGRFLMKVNGSTIFDVTQANYPSDNTSMMGIYNYPVNRIMLSQVYGAGNNSASAAPIYQWMTNFQIWNGIPAVLPTVTGSSPASGPTAGGTAVTVTGTGFSVSTPTVKFGSVAGTNVVVTNDTTLTVNSPAENAGTVDIAVTTTNGTSNSNPPDTFTFNAPPPPPTVTAVSPTNGPDLGGTTVTVTGTGFSVGTPTVKFGKIAGTNVVVTNDTTLTVTSPQESAGTEDVIVTTTNGVSALSSADQYTFNLVLPAVPTGLAVACTSTPTVTWNSVTNATSYGVYRNGTLVATVTGTSYVDNNTSPATNYSYTVLATDSQGSSAQTAPVSVRTCG